METTGEVGLERPSKGFVSARSKCQAFEHEPGVLVRAIKGSEGTVEGLSDIFAAPILAVRKTPRKTRRGGKCGTRHFVTSPNLHFNAIHTSSRFPFD
jgi:hypothetical protein